MHLIVAVMLGIGMASSAPAPAPARATGELTPGEKLFQGAWQLTNLDGGGVRPGALHVEGRDFRADVVHGRYAGYVSIRADPSPAQIDFTIEDCGGCNLEGQTVLGIYREDDGTLVFVAPGPGEPRPTTFTGLNEETHVIQRATRMDPFTAGSGEASR